MLRTDSNWFVVALTAALSAGCPGDGGDGTGDARKGEGTDGGDATREVDTSEDTGADADATSFPCPAEEVEEWYPDSDGDGFGDASATPERACSKPGPTMITKAGDCDDSNDEVYPGADERCNGRDDDCDGTSDASDEVVARECNLQKGLCSGSTVATCTDDGQRYRSCGAEEYGDAYRTAGDEAWRCDGVDNDCDGEVDEACCGSGEDVSPLIVAEPGGRGVRPKIVPAAPGAPRDATHLLAWNVDEKLHLQHVSRSGLARGDSESRTLNAPVQSVDLIRSGEGYAIAITRKRQAVQKSALIVRYGADLSRKTPATKLEETGDAARNISMLRKDDSLWVTYDFVGSDSTHTVRAAVVDATNGQLSILPFDIAGTDFQRAVAPQIKVVADEPMVVWWDKDGAEIWGVQLANGFPDNRFQIEVGPTNSLQSTYREPLGLVSRQGLLGVVYPDYGQQARSNLAYLEVDAEASGTIEPSSTAITKRQARNRQPVLELADLDGDGAVDERFVLWARGPRDDPDLVAGGLVPERPAEMNPQVVRQSGEETHAPGISVVDKRVGATWFETKDAKVQYAPVSIDGVPICDPNPS